MKFEFNKQRIIGIAIIIVFLMIAIPFLFAQPKKDHAVGNDNSQIPIDIPNDKNKSEMQLNSQTKDLKDVDEDNLTTDGDNDVLSKNTDSGEKQQKDQATSDQPTTDDAASISEQEKSTPQNSDKAQVEGASGDQSNVKDDQNSTVDVNSKSIQTSSVAPETVQTDVAAVNTTPEQVQAKQSVPMVKKAKHSNVSSTNAKSMRVAKLSGTKYAANSSVHANKSVNSSANGYTKKVSHEPVSASSKKHSASIVTSKQQTHETVWFVQVGNFSDAKLAKNTETKLRAKGYKNVYARKVQTKKGTFERIFIGPVQQKQKAYSIAAKVKEHVPPVKVVVFKTEKLKK